MSEEGRGGLGQGQRGLVGAGEGLKGRGWVGYLPARTVLCTVGTLRPAPPITALAANEKGENALTVEVFIIIVKFILHIVCVLSYGKVYERNNIFDKKSQYMIFHVLLKCILGSGPISVCTILCAAFPLVSVFSCGTAG